MMHGTMEQLGTVRGKGGKYSVLIACGTGMEAMEEVHGTYKFEPLR